jgi:hypothetical protein
MGTSQDVYEKVKAVMQKYGIPYYIWKPIARAESGMNPNALNDSGKEYSVGIFQINRNAHPQYNVNDLLDPTINAKIAARDFLLPAFNYAKTIAPNDPWRQSLIVYSGLKDPLGENELKGYIPSGGIRPKWTPALMNKFTGYFNETAGMNDFLYQSPLESDLSGTIQPQPGATPSTGPGGERPSVWGWITGKNDFLDGITRLTGDQREARTTLTLLFIGGILLVLMSIGFMFGEEIITIAAPEAGLAMKAAGAAKSE